MLLPISELLQDFNIQPKRILHVGAHLAEESNDYAEYFRVPVIWIEAQPKLCQELKQSLDLSLNTVIEACVLDKDDAVMTLNVTSNSQSTSILNFGTHADTYPDVVVTELVTVRTKRLDSLLSGKEVPDFINLDIQGVELKAIMSLGVLLDQVKAIYTEVNKRHVYVGCNLIQDMDAHLKKYGFKRITTRWKRRSGWGDALYINEKIPRRNFIQYIRSNFRLVKFYSPNRMKSLI